MKELLNKLSKVSTRALLAILWSLYSMGALSYILYKWGYRMEITTLIIGLIGGTIIGSIFGVYFAGSHSTKPTISQTADSITNSPVPGADDQTTN